MRNYIILPLLLLCTGLFAQDRIALENPSFEDTPRAGKVPQDWINCGPSEQTPPDVHPNDLPPYHFFGVNMRPDEGWTYLGMVARDNGTQESVSQKLSAPLQANVDYLFSIVLARSEIYYSGPRGEVDFTKPIVLRIWGGNEPCGTEELLAFTTPVEDPLWLEYVFTLSPTQNWDYLTFEAYYEGDKPYNGHLLLDNCSELVPLPSVPPREELEALDDAGLEKIVLETIDKYQGVDLLPDLATVPYMGVCYKTRQFEKQAAESGLRALVMNTPFAELTSLIRALEAIQLGENLTLLKEVVRISLRDSKDISPTEYRYFENADMTFRENEALEPIAGKRLEFIKKYRGLIIEELTKL